MAGIDRAVETLEDGELVVYPTETVYGLGGDALDETVVERVFSVKQRPRSNPMALAVASVDAALSLVNPDSRSLQFMREFLPGPVTVVCEKRAVVPDALTGGRDRVGIRIPDHEQALVLLERTPPLTATSANVSGRSPCRRLADLDPAIEHGVAMCIDGGTTPGGITTVVDVSAGHIHRPGRQIEAVEAWLEGNPRGE